MLPVEPHCLKRNEGDNGCYNDYFEFYIMVIRFTCSCTKPLQLNPLMGYSRCNNSALCI